ASLGAAQHRLVRRRPGQRDHLGRVRRRPVGAGPPGLAGLARAVREGDRAERLVRAETAAAGRGRGRRPGGRRPDAAPRPDRGAPFAAQAGCPDQTATCLRHLPVSALLFNGAAIPGVVDGKVLKEPIGTALAAGRFARVPVLNGVNHVENAIFVGIGLPVIGGRNVKIPRQPVSADNYHRNIAVVFGASPARTAQIVAQYPLAAYPSAAVAFSILASDAGFVCPAFQVDGWTSGRVPTFAYEFDDDSVPHILFPPGTLPPVATHGDQIQ